MVVFEVFAGVAPFTDSPPTTVAVEVLSGGRPWRPKHPSLTDEVWNLAQHCWEQDPMGRPTMLEVVSDLVHALIARRDHANVSGDNVALGNILCEVLRRLRDAPALVTGGPRLTRINDARSRSFHSVESDESETSLHPTCGGSNKPVGVQSTCSSPRSLLRRATFWKSDWGTSHVRSCDGRPGVLSEKVLL